MGNRATVLCVTGERVSRRCEERWLTLGRLHSGIVERGLRAISWEKKNEMDMK